VDSDNFFLDIDDPSLAGFCGGSEKINYIIAYSPYFSRFYNKCCGQAYETGPKVITK
jgi:hypothetical protein